MSINGQFQFSTKFGPELVCVFCVISSPHTQNRFVLPVAAFMTPWEEDWGFFFFFGESLPDKYSHSLTTCTMCVLNKSLLSHGAWGVLGSLCRSLSPLFSVQFHLSWSFPAFISPPLLPFSIFLIESSIIWSRLFFHTHRFHIFLWGAMSRWMTRWSLQRPDPLNQAQASLATRHWCIGAFWQGHWG